MSLAAGLWLAGPAAAQEEAPVPGTLIDIQPADEGDSEIGLAAAAGRIVFPGSMAVSGFSGTTIPGMEAGLPPGVDPVDETFIDTSGATLRIFDVSVLGQAPSGRLAYPPQPFEVTAGQIGQVFGLTYDDGMRDGEATGVPNLYAAATSLHGIAVVTPDEDGDGRPERRLRGAAGATFVAGQFGAKNGGGPGTIWKIDGLSGAVTLFADIDSNSGPGLADVTFDRGSRQFFASDLDTGLVHRIDASGALVDAFDHGVDGRPARSLEPIADDGVAMDIESAVFESEDPDSWGLTQAERRVLAVAAQGGRLYYAVGLKAQIWSVGFAPDGTFAGDPRWELTVAAQHDLAVTDIAFDQRGFMYLAGRGEPENRFDHSQFAAGGQAEVMRYWRESPDDPATDSIWTPAPQRYAAGFPDRHLQAAGGVDLQYGYDSRGGFDSGACSATLVETGDRLRDDPALADRLAAGGPLAVHGVQITATALVRPKNEPPFGSWFVDFDGFFEDPEAAGHVGDVEVWRPCEGRAGWYEELSGGFLPPFYPPPLSPPGDVPPCIDIGTVDYFCTPAGLEADLHVRDVAGIDGDSVEADSRTVGVDVSPQQQTAASGAPFTLGISGHIPGDTIDVGLCFYRKSDADQGGYHPCCKVVVPLRTPALSCEP